MTIAEILESLKHLSNSDRLAVIETAAWLVREELAGLTHNTDYDDPVLRNAGSLSGHPLSALSIDDELYGEDLRPSA